MKSLDELRALREKLKDATLLREGADVRVVVGMGTCGIAAGARTALLAIMDELALRGVRDVTVSQTGCIGMCEKEPLVEVIKGNERTLYSYVNADRARSIVVSHIVNNQPLTEWIILKG